MIHKQIESRFGVSYRAGNWRTPSTFSDYLVYIIRIIGNALTRKGSEGSRSRFPLMLSQGILERLVIGYFIAPVEHGEFHEIECALEFFHELGVYPGDNLRIVSESSTAKRP